MPTYTITRPDGVWEVDADSDTQATKKLSDSLLKDKADAEYQSASNPGKAAMIMDDYMRNAAHGLTAGWFDKGLDYLTGGHNVEDTAKSTARMGPALTGVTRAGGAMLLPSGVAGTVARVGGGPIAKTVTGMLTAGAEGAGYGGAEALSQGDPLNTGAGSGAIGGMLGQGAAQVVRGGVNTAAKAIQGIDDVPPIRKMFVPPKSPTGKDLIDVATAKAQAAGAARGDLAEQAAQKQLLGKLSTGPNRSKMSPEQLRLIGKVTDPSIGEQATNALGGFLENKFVAGGLGATSGFASGGVLPGVLASGAAMGAGRMLRKDAAAATQEAVDNLRRTVYRKKRYMGPISARDARTAGQGAGYGAYDILDNYLQDN